MKRRTLTAIVVLVTAWVGVFVWVFSPSDERATAVTPCTANIIGMTNGLVGPMSAGYQRFSSNTAATIRQWYNDGTNAAVVRVTNHQSSAIWLFPFVTIQTQTNASGVASAFHDSLLLDAPTFSGIRLAAGQAGNLQIATFAQTNSWRFEVGYTRERGSSFAERVRNLRRDLQAAVTGRGIVENTTPIYTEWVQP